MMATTVFGYLVVLGNLIWTIAASGHSVAISLKCSEYPRAAIIESGKSFKDICGDKTELSIYTNYTSFSNADVLLYFGSFDYVDEKAEELMRFSIGSLSQYSTWNVSNQDAMKTVNNDNIPCGTGFLIAQVRDNGATVGTAVGRGVRVCNNSHSDVELRIDINPEVHHRVTLVAGDPSDVVTQLSRGGVNITKSVLHNHGNTSLGNATEELPHLVVAFLQKGRKHHWYDGCMLPEFSVMDEIVGHMATTKGIRAGEEYDFMPDMYGHKLSAHSRVCGDADLVVFYDPLQSDYDSNPCNNFRKLEVYVDCYSRGMQPQRSECSIIPNPIETNKLWATFGTERFYEFNDMENSWQERDIGDGVYAGMSYMTTHHLSALNMDPKRGLCAFTSDSMEDLVHSMDPAIESSPVPHLNKDVESRIGSLVARIFKDPNDMYLENDINNLEQEGKGDMVSNSIMVGSAHGLKMGRSFYMTKRMSQMYMTPLPENLTRSMLGPMLIGVAKLMHGMEMNPMVGYYKNEILKWTQAMRILLTFVKDDIQPKPAMILQKLTDRIVNHFTMGNNGMETSTPGYWTTSSGTWTSEMSCPFGTHMSKITKVLFRFGHSWDGIHTYDSTDMELCQGALLTTFLRTGGAHVVGRRINAKDTERLRLYHDKLPTTCRHHPIIPYDLPRQYWANKEGLIWKGGLSPLSGRMEWKAVATCHCDQTACHDGDDMYSTTHSWWSESSTRSWMESTHYMHNQYMTSPMPGK